MKSRTRYLLVLASAATLGMAFGTAPGRAEFLDGFSGNSRGLNEINPPGRADITWNFAVLDRTGGSPGDTFGTGFSGFDGMATPRGDFEASLFDKSAKYLYLYQDTNDGIEPGVLAVVDCRSKRCFEVPITFFATWELVFEDSDGPVDANQPFGVAEDAWTLSAPANTGVTNPKVGYATPGSAGAGPWLPFDNIFEADPNGFMVVYDPNDPLVPNTGARLYGFTANEPPKLVHFPSVTDSVAIHTISSTVPVPAIPSAVPATNPLVAALLGLVLASFGFARIVKRTNAPTSPRI